MASRKEYTDCMIPHMKGGGPDRKLRFCTGAKLCSGTAKTEQEAKQICINQPAKEAKPRKSRSGKCVTDPAKLAACISTKLDMGTLTAANLPARVEEALTACSTAKPAPVKSYKRFMNACLKEAGAGGDFAASQPVIKKCQSEWNAQKAAGND